MSTIILITSLPLVAAALASYVSRRSNGPRRSRTRRAAVTIAALPVLAPALAACSSSSSSPSAGTEAPSSTSASPSSDTRSASPARADCTSAAILATLPRGAAMEKYTCATVGGNEWAAARVNPGNTAFFLKWTGSTWDASTPRSVCGTASAGLPQPLLAYCKA